MPNWCTVDVIVTSKDGSAIQRLAETISGIKGEKSATGGSFYSNTYKAYNRQDFVKYDAEPALGRLFEDYEQRKNDSDCAWNEANLGVKWDCCNTEPLFTYYDTKNKQHTLSFWFDSPWSAPCLAFDKMAKSFPEVRIRVNYREEGMGFKGCLWYNKGKKTVDRVSDI